MLKLFQKYVKKGFCFVIFSMEHLLTFDTIMSLVTLTLLEVVLGIDNVVFMSIVIGKLPKEQHKKASNTGLILALIPRLGLLSLITVLMHLEKPLIQWQSIHFTLSGKGLILLLGGLFLIYNSTTEIHNKLEGEIDDNDEDRLIPNPPSFASIMVRIMLLNIVFSFDSVLTAVGLAQHIEIMVFAVVFSTLIMILFARKIGEFVNNHPTVKMLALSFLLLIGFMLVVEAFEIEIPKGYIYFAMGFSLFVELLNLTMRKRSRPIKLKNSYSNKLNDSLLDKKIS
jgi:predicted tellurium resistance membrane protein TerC